MLITETRGGIAIFYRLGSVSGNYNRGDLLAKCPKTVTTAEAGVQKPGQKKNIMMVWIKIDYGRIIGEDTGTRESKKRKRVSCKKVK